MLPNPLKTKNVYRSLDELDAQKFDILDAMQGIDEWYINNTENIIIVKYNVDIQTPEAILDIIKK